jgi:hypothetical protein
VHEYKYRKAIKRKDFMILYMVSVCVFNATPTFSHMASCRL